VGYQAGYAVTTGTITAFGSGAGVALTTGTDNTFIGKSAGNTITTGAINTFVGMDAGGNTATGVSGSVCLGRAAGYGLAATNTLYIARDNVGAGNAGCWIFGSSAGACNQGNNSSSWSVTSDQRLKKNIVDNNIGLDIINQIQVRNFEYRLPEEVTDLPQNQSIQKQGIQLGVIAQELQQILPECVKTESGVMTVNADNLTWYLVNAIKELKAEVDSLKSQLNQRA